MRAMKDSGVDWIGQIPEDWSVSNSGNFFAYSSGDTLTNESISNNGEFLVYGANGVRGFYSDYNLEGKYILLGRVGAQCGNVHIVNGKNWVTEHALIVRKKLPAIEEYYGYAFMSMNLIQYSKASAQPVISSETISKLRIPIPPIAEQERIADYLDKRCGAIDSSIELLNQQVENLTSYKQSLITEAVTHGLDPNAPMKDSGIEWIGKVPSGWEKGRFCQECYVRARLGWKGLKADEYVPEGYAFISAFNIQDGKLIWDPLNYITKERYDESPEIKIKIGDVLIVKDGAGIGKCARVDALPMGETAPNGSLAVVTPRSRLEYRYLAYSVQSTVFQSMIFKLWCGMGVPHFTQEVMKEISILIPSLSEQQAIADYLDKKCASIDESIERSRALIEELGEYKKSLIYEVVTGKREV